MAKFISEVSQFFKKLTHFEFYQNLFSEFSGFVAFLNIYFKDKLFFLFGHFEGSKGSLVRNVLIKRGKRNRIFLHISAMTLLTIGVVVSPFISDTNIFGENKNLSFAQGSESSLSTPDVFNTQQSEKPRDKIITYTVQKGDTLSTVAKKFGINADTIKWENNLLSDNITDGDTLEILPVTGVAHKVVRGDTIYTIAKKYSTNAQGIVDFPFNDFANPQTFSLIEGQILIVPEGVPPKAAPTYVRPRAFIAAGPVSITAGGFTWPIQGTINQSYAWYHRALDLGAPIGTPVASATNGSVSEVYVGGWNGGYGTHVLVSGDNGYTTLYAHMSSVNVSVGQAVTAGKTIVGWVGMTGRTTGPHLHFEVRGAGSFLDPLSVLR